jgi:hypothetical protein
MTDIAVITKRAHDEGFSQGSVATANVFLAWIERTLGQQTAEGALVAWNDGTMIAAPPALVTPPEPPPTVLPSPRQMGYTGNTCTYCSSTRMTVSGHCEKCEDCGESSGCS